MWLAYFSVISRSLLCVACCVSCAAPSKMGVRSVTACAELQRAPREPERPTPATYAGASLCVGFE